MSNQADASTSTVVCPYCGKENPRLAAHCAQCGKEVKQAPPRPTPGQPRSSKPHQSIFWEFLAFIKHEKKYWMIPLIVVLLIVGALIAFTSSSPLAPFLYPLF